MGASPVKRKFFAGLMMAVLASAAAGQDKSDSKSDSYFWYDGGKRKQVVLDRSVVAEFDKYAGSATAPAGTGMRVRVLRKDDPAVSRGAAQGNVSPVLRDSAGGRMRALPGNVIVRLDPLWTRAQVDAWLAAQGLAMVRQLPIGNNVLVVSAPPGLASLALANRLQESGTVVSAQPEWWEQLERR